LAVARSDCGDRQAEFSGGTSAAEYTVTAAAGSAWTVPSAATVQHVRGPDLGGGTKGLLYSLRNGLPTFNRYNGRGDVVAQSDIDGTTTWAASYQADGRRTAEAGTNIERHRACTKEEDPTGLLNEGFRYRDMETGTFISRDPLGHVDGPNVYCYVGQNPWTAFDPEGLNELALEHVTKMQQARDLAKHDNTSVIEHYQWFVRKEQELNRPIAQVVGPVYLAGAAVASTCSVVATVDAAVAWAASRYPLATATTIATTTFLEATGQLPFALPSPKSRSFSGSQCFPAGTPVWTADGSACIESIRPGDVILTRSQKSGKPVACEVTRVFVHEYTGEFVTITLSGGECVTSTKNHPFRVLAGEGLASRPNSVDAGSDASLVGPSGARWVDAADLRLGDVTWTSNGPQAITGIIRDYRSATVYNLGVSLERTYLVGESGVLVHNKTPDVDMGGGGTLPRAYNAAEANPLELPGAGTVGAANSAVKPGQAGTYGELKEQKKAFGETEPLDMDHRPSYAAQVKAAEAAKGAPLSKAELAKLKANTQAVATPRADHQTKSRTYGGRNTDARSTADAADLDAAKAADDAAYR
jgi:RHS repeat-associated protein